MEIESKLCRVCLDLGDYNIKDCLLTVSNKDIQIETMLEKFTSLDLINIHFESIPSMICSSCAENLLQCYEFLLKIQKTEDLLINFFQIKSETDKNLGCQFISNEDKNKTDIIDYIYDVEYVEQLDDDDNKIETFDDPDTKLNEIKENQQTSGKRKKSPPFVFIKKESSLPSHVNDDSKNLKKSYKKGKPTNICKSTNTCKSTNEDLSFLITKFVPSEYTGTNTTTSAQHQIDDVQDEFEVEKSDLNRLQHRTYDLAAVEIDPTDNNQFQKLVGKNFDEDDDDDSGSNSDAIYACQYCTRAFSSSHFLKQHVRKRHLCQFCMKGFEITSELFEHIRKNHSKFSCPFCQKSYSINGNLRQHMKRVHTFILPPHTSLLSFNKKATTFLSDIQDH